MRMAKTPEKRKQRESRKVDRIHEILDFWFGDLGQADLPSSDRTQLWFGEDDSLKLAMMQKYGEDFSEVIAGKRASWAESARGCLCLILFYDQFSRCFYRHSAKAFAYDSLAQSLCLEGIEHGQDQTLTLIERVFFYMPLVHSEHSEHQEKSIRLFQQLVGLSMQETTQVYQLFLAYAYAHFRVIKEFGRFPQRNILLGRQSTQAEEAFLKST